MAEKKVVHVAVGVIVDESQETQRVFLTRRHLNVHQGGKWEFPGGKVETNETVAQALSRELSEEVNIEPLACQPLLKVEHDYGDKQVLLDVYLVNHFNGQPSPQEGQESAWYDISQLADIDFPKANVAIVEALAAYYG